MLHCRGIYLGAGAVRGNLVAINLILVLIYGGLYGLLILLDLHEDLLDLVLLEQSLGRHILLLQLLLLLILLIDHQPLLLQVAEDQSDAVVCVVWQQDTEGPWLFVVDLAPADAQEVRVVQVALDIIDCWQGTPTDKFPNAFHFRLRLKHEEDGLANDHIDINVNLLEDLLPLLIGDCVFLFLNAGVDGDAAVPRPTILQTLLLSCRSRRLVLHPNLLVVVVQAQVELSDH